MGARARFTKFVPTKNTMYFNRDISRRIFGEADPSHQVMFRCVIFRKWMRHVSIEPDQLKCIRMKFEDVFV